MTRRFSATRADPGSCPLALPLEHRADGLAHGRSDPSRARPGDRRTAVRGLPGRDVRRSPGRWRPLSDRPRRSQPLRLDRTADLRRRLLPGAALLRPTPALARLAAIQVGLLAAGITASALAWTWRIEKGGASDLITASQSVVALGFVLLGVIVSGTLAFGKSGQATVSAVPMVKQFKRPQPPLQPTGH